MVVMTERHRKKIAKHLHQMFQPRELLLSVNAGLINGILLISVQISLAALVFSGSLHDYVSYGIGFVLAGAFVIGIVAAMAGSYPGTVAAPQDAPVVILALMASTIAANIPASEGAESIFITVVAATVISSLLTGAFLWTLGRFRLGNLIRFIPYPVIGGFLAGTGWLLLMGGLGVLTGESPGISNLSYLLQPEMLMRWLPSLVFAILILLILRRFHHFLIMPALILTAAAVFFLILYFSDTSVSEAGARGWLLGPFPAERLWQPITPGAIRGVNWAVLTGQIGNIGSIVIISVIALLLNAGGLELAIKRDLDFNRELQSTGIANLMAGLCGSPIGYLYLSQTSLTYRLGAHSRLTGILAAAMCGIAIFFGAPAISIFPKPVLGSLLLFAGLSFLVEWVYESWFKLPKLDCFLILFIMVIIGSFGLLEGVAVGMLIAVVLFVVNYSRINVIKHILSGANYQSNVERAAPFRKLLRNAGEQLYILKLQGFIFFGTAHNLLDRVRQRTDAPDLPGLRFVVLDFRIVSGLDSSAMNSFVKLNRLARTRGLKLVFTHLSSELQHQFIKAGLLEDHDGNFQIFPDLDRGIEWCENQIIKTEKAAIDETLTKKLETLFLDPVFGTVIAYMQRQEAAKGSYLIRRGDPPKGLYFIESGQVTTLLEQEDNEVIRLRTNGAGTFIGEIGMFLGQPASASVIADKDCIIFFLSLENLKKLEQAAPDVSASFHKFIIRMLAERLISNTRSLKALTD
jgi:SulP family sulfate permease